MIRRISTTILSCAAISLMAGCFSVGPNYKDPNVIVPDTWYYGVARDVSKGGSSDLETWWKNFNDPVLNSLIDQARVANKDLQIAASRVREARSARGVAASQLFPFLNGGGTYQRSRTSDNVNPIIPSTTSNYFAAGFDAGWEIDIFGGVRRSIESAEASEEGAVENYRDALVTLYSEVALNYVELRTFDRRILLAKENAERQLESSKLTQDRFDAGLVPKIDVTQAISNLRATEAAIPQFEQQRVYALNRLSTLLGGFPGSLEKKLRPGRGIPMPRSSVSEGVPVELMRSRPDVRRAERALAAQTAQVGVITSELYPKFSLSGFFDLQSIDADDFFNSASRAWGFAPSFRWNIFNAGQIRNSIKVEEARTEQALLNYEQSILLAMEEVEDAMVGIQFERLRFKKLSEASASTMETVKLVRENYTSGLVDFQNVLDAERTLARDQDNAASSEGEVSKNYVRLYKALGGGSPPPEELIESPKTSKSAAVGDNKAPNSSPNR